MKFAIVAMAAAAGLIALPAGVVLAHMEKQPRFINPRMLGQLARNSRSGRRPSMLTTIAR